MSAGDAFFADTNSLLYAVDPREAHKHRRANEWVHVLWYEGSGRLSYQVLHEFYVNTLVSTCCCWELGSRWRQRWG